MLGETQGKFRSRCRRLRTELEKIMPEPRRRRWRLDVKPRRVAGLRFLSVGELRDLLALGCLPDLFVSRIKEHIELIERQKSLRFRVATQINRLAVAIHPHFSTLRPRKL